MIGGYIEDVRITRGEATYRPRILSGFKLRLAILWAAVKNLFTGKGVWLNSTIQASVGTPGLYMETWIKPQMDKPWAHWAVNFDGKKATGYLDGSEV